MNRLALFLIAILLGITLCEIAHCKIKLPEPDAEAIEIGCTCNDAPHNAHTTDVRGLRWYLYVWWLGPSGREERLLGIYDVTNHGLAKSMKDCDRWMDYARKDLKFHKQLAPKKKGREI
jgi:hypothetical protein